MTIPRQLARIFDWAAEIVFLASLVLAVWWCVTSSPLVRRGKMQVARAASGPQDAKGGAPAPADKAPDAKGGISGTAASAAAPVVGVEGLPPVVLEKGKAKVVKLTIKNLTDNALHIAAIQITLTTPEPPREARKITVTGWTPGALDKGGATEIALNFPAHAQIETYGLALSLTTTEKPSETTAPFYFLTVQVKEPEPYLVSRLWSAVVALLFVLIGLLLTVLGKGKDERNFFQSPDGAVSVSKVQVWIWTMVIVFSYVYLYLSQGPPDSLPDSLWELMGISAASTAVARAIPAMTGKPAESKDPKVKEAIEKQWWLPSMLSDDGQPNMMRLQMFGWTLVTAVLFVIYLIRNEALWSVPPGLVILMGISHAGYLGDKGAAATGP